MSIKIMNAVWADGPEDHAGLLVLLAMADIADDAGKLWPSVATIAAKARMSERNARRVIRALEVDGWISTTISRGRNNTSTYVINADKITGQNNRTKCPPGQNNRISTVENRTNGALKPDIAVSAEPPKNHVDAVDAREGMTFRERILTEMKRDPVSGIDANGRVAGTRADMAEAERWLALPGLTEDLIIEEIARIVAKQGPPTSFRYFTKAMQALSGELSAAPLSPITPRPKSPSQQSEQDRKLAFYQRVIRANSG